MKDQIILYREDPVQLEKLYRSNKSFFRKEFNKAYPEIKGSQLSQFWHERLNFENEEVIRGSSRDLIFVIVASLISGIIAKLPAIVRIEEEFFYPRNIGFIVFPALAAYFIWKNKLSAGKTAVIAGVFLTAAVYINFLPNVSESDTFILSCIHLLFFLWAILGYAYVGAKNTYTKRLDFLKYNGDLLVMSALICIAGGIMTGITIGLFSIIGLDIENFYFEYIVVFALPAVPILGTWLTQSNPQLVGKVSPVIARIFSPLVLVMLVIYLVSMVFSGKDPYSDREFLLIFNILLIGVMAIIFFSIAGSSGAKRSRLEMLTLLLLSIVSIIVNGIALSAILFRISEWGITPNRIAVLGANILILINLIMVTGQLLKVVSNKSDLDGVGKTIAHYLPVYIIWVILVTFTFPLIFGFQ
ncbi:DUF4153 domain-containing protein [Salinimicrobium xinjiangense]|uniref:DUF4153 domain-containing protein n=1 Tax=Salinimicrobium xinjiangense TaxID=438596 RepID=UPI00040EEDB6|nr:DUF4153 domain-containing protein [Salinimicrobium xinjiangense]